MNAGHQPAKVRSGRRHRRDPELLRRLVPRLEQDQPTIARPRWVGARAPRPSRRCRRDAPSRCATSECPRAWQRAVRTRSIGHPERSCLAPRGRPTAISRTFVRDDVMRNSRPRPPRTDSNSNIVPAGFRVNAEIHCRRAAGDRSQCRRRASMTRRATDAPRLAIGINGKVEDACRRCGRSVTARTGLAGGNGHE